MGEEYLQGPRQIYSWAFRYWTKDNRRTITCCRRRYNPVVTSCNITDFCAGLSHRHPFTNHTTTKRHHESFVRSNAILRHVQPWKGAETLNDLRLCPFIEDLDFRRLSALILKSVSQTSPDRIGFSCCVVSSHSGRARVRLWQALVQGFT
jgi:hypothetical protein